MPVLTRSSFADGAPTSATATADNGRPVNPLYEAHSSVDEAANGGQMMLLSPLHYSPPQIAQPRKQRKSKVSRQLWPAAKSASNMSIPKGQAAAKPPVSLSEVHVSVNSLGIQLPIRAKDSLAIGRAPNAQALVPGPTSGSSNYNPERFAFTPSLSPDIDSLRGPSGFRTPAKAITYNMSESPQLVRGKKRSRSGGEEMSPTERHMLEKRRMRAFF